MLLSSCQVLPAFLQLRLQYTVVPITSEQHRFNYLSIENWAKHGNFITKFPFEVVDRVTSGGEHSMEQGKHRMAQNQ
jgi:hypothetical protein